MSLFAELKRRNVFRVGLAYVLIAWVLLQAADFGLDLIGAPNWVIQALFLLALLGLPVALVFAWVYEMTPEGLKLERDIDRTQSITPSTGRKLDRIIIIFLAVTVVFLVAGRYYGVEPTAETAAETATGEKPKPVQPETSRIPSIAVLPFVNMSSDPEQEYFADGISEEILNALSRVSGLKVAGRTSSFAFKGQNQDLRTIGEALGVDNILEGSVRKQDDRVRITAQLVQASDGFHLWSDTYDRTLEDIFAIQDEIATAILEQAKIQLLDNESIASTRVNPAAYQNYVAAKQRIHERNKDGLVVAMNLLKDAVDLDPGFAGAWAQLAIATLLSSDGSGSYGDIPEAKANRLSREYIDKALALNPDLPEGLAALGFWYQAEPPITTQRLEQSIELLRRSLALDPVPIDTSHWLGRALQIAGHVGESQELLEDMVERDPFYWPAVSNLVSLYARQDRLEEAHALNDRTIRYRPELPFRQKSLLYDYQGDYARGLPLALEVWNERQDPLVFGNVAFSYFGLGQIDELAAMENAPDGTNMAVALTLSGRPEEGKMVAQAAFVERGTPWPMIAMLTLSGQYDEAIRFVESTWADVDAFMSEFNPSTGVGARGWLNLALAYQETGERESYQRLMTGIRSKHDRELSQGFNNMFLNLAEACYWSLAGEVDRALPFLEKAVDRGYSITPRLSRANPQLKSLEGNPRYEEIQAQSLAHMNEQRSILGLEPLAAAY